MGGAFTRWSEEEIAILNEMWTTPGTIKSQLHKLPGRSWEAIRHFAGKHKMPPRRYGNPYSWVQEVVDAELKKGRALTSLQIADLTPASHPRINEILRKGRGTRYYIAGWLRTREYGDWYPKWAWGHEDDVPRPPKKDKIRQMAEYRARKKLKAGAQENNPFATVMIQVLDSEPVKKTKGRYKVAA